MNALARSVVPLFGTIAVLLPSARGADVFKANNADALNLTTSWTGGAVPGSADTAVWDSTSFPASAPGTQPQLGADLSIFGIRIANPGGAVNTNNTGIAIQNGSSANTLTLGGGGIDLSTATQGLFFQSKILLSANQNWTINNANTNTSAFGFNNGEDVAFQAQALNAPINFGGFTANVTGTGAITITSGYNLSNGTLDVSIPLFVIQGGTNRLTTIESTLATNINTGGTVRLQSNSGALTANGAFNLKGGTLALFVNNATNAVTLNGNINALNPSTISIQSPANGALVHTGMLTGSAAITIDNVTADVARFLQLNGNNSGYSGTITLGGTAGRVTRLTSATAGSANATWNVNTGHTLQVAGVSVNLGIISGLGTINSSAGAATINVGSGTFPGVLQNGAGTLALAKVGTGTLTLTGANTYTGATQVTNGTLLTSPLQTGATTVNVSDGATFGVNLSTLGTTFNSTSLTTGTTTGASLLINNGTLANPTVAPFTVGTFTPTAATTIRLAGNNLSVANGIPLIDYTTLGGLGFAGLSVSLPPRTTGSLVDNTGATRVDLNITAIDFPRWNGNINGNWDVDPTGAGVVGTANWREVISGNSTRFLQGTGGIDSALFDDNAAGTTAVNLTTTLTPTITTVNNNTLTYTFGGTGKLSGSGALLKQGTGTLILANSTPFDHTGGTTISAGTLQIGDGATLGVGALANAITDNANLALNRPDDFTFGNAVSGTGNLTKLGSNIATVTGALTYSGTTAVNNGRLVLNTASTLAGPVTIANGATLQLDNATGTVSGNITDNGDINLNTTASLNATVSGSGTLTVNSPGNKAIGGAAANTYTGLTTVTAGNLSLNKSNAGVGVPAIGGDLLIDGGTVTVGALGDQIADTASITVNSGTFLSSNRTDTVANVTINASAPVSTLSGLNITGTLAVTAGIQHDVANSNGTTSANTVNLSNTNVRLGANGGPSTFNIGAGGLSLANASIVYGSAGNAAQLATVTLAGNVNSSGLSAFDVNTGNPMSRIDLGTSTRTFNVIDGTTTVESAIVSSTGTSGLTKTGSGTLLLSPGTNTNGVSTYTGPTTVNGGSLIVDGSVTASAIAVNAGGTLGGNGSILAANINSGGSLSPGNNSIGTLTANGGVVFASGGIFSLEINSDLLTLNTDLLNATGIVSLASATLATVDLGFSTLSSGEQFVFVLGSNIVGEFAGHPDLSYLTIGNSIYQIDYTSTSVTLTATAVPEPNSLSVLATALASFIGLRRRRR